jgi:hypothetical protein
MRKFSVNGVGNPNRCFWLEDQQRH